MKIKIIKPLILKGAPGVQFQPGSIAEVMMDIGREWIEKGYATSASIDKTEPEKAVIEPQEKRETVKSRVKAK